METLNEAFFGLWYFFQDFLFFLFAFLMIMGIIFSLIYQFWKRP